MKLYKNSHHNNVVIENNNNNKKKKKKNNNNDSIATKSYIIQESRPKDFYNILLTHQAPFTKDKTVTID